MRRQNKKETIKTNKIQAEKKRPQEKKGETRGAERMRQGKKRKQMRGDNDERKRSGSNKQTH